MTSATTVCKKLLNVKSAVIDDIVFSKNCYEEEVLTIKVRPHKSERWRCPTCGRRCKVYDHPYEHKRWRALDLRGIIAYLEASVPRVICPEHGVKTARVMWAYPDSSFTKDFEFTAVWLSRYLNRSAVSKYLRVDWKTVGRSMTRVHKDLEPNILGRLDDLKKIGIDETSYKKGHKYITVVINHETNCVVWAHKGKGKAVLKEFFELLSDEQRSLIEVVSADGARWITDCINTYIPWAKRCTDPFHVVQWAGEALDGVRKKAYRDALSRLKDPKAKNKVGRPSLTDTKTQARLQTKREAQEIKHSLYALGKAPENLTEAQRTKLEMIQKNDKRLYRAYLLKEDLRLLLKIKDRDEAERELMAWVSWARRSRIEEFVELQKKIMRHKDYILNTLELGLSNARIEATNNKIKLLIRKSFGFRDVNNLIDMVLLFCSNLQIPLPNRSPLRYA